MSSNGDVLLRQWEMLLRIPQEPRRLSTKQIASFLESSGYQVSLRSVQRDLINLSSKFGYIWDQEGRTYYWYFPKGIRAMTLPGMDAPTALVFNLAQRHLAPVLPNGVLKALEPFFERAVEILRRDTPGKLSGWQHRIKVINRGPGLMPPKLDHDVQHTISDALLNNYQLDVQYTPRSGEHNAYILNPYGLVVRDGVIYLVGCVEGKPDPVHFALHRFKQVTMSTKRSKIPKDFSLSAYVDQSLAFSYPNSDEMISLKVKFDAGVALHLEERPITEDQVLKFDDEGSAVLTAKVMDTSELRWWLLGFGGQVEVLSPKSLRNWFATEAVRLGEMYR